MKPRTSIAPALTALLWLSSCLPSLTAAEPFDHEQAFTATSPPTPDRLLGIYYVAEINGRDLGPESSDRLDCGATVAFSLGVDHELSGLRAELDGPLNFVILEKVSDG